MDVSTRQSPEKIDLFACARRFGRALGRMWVIVLALAVAFACIGCVREYRSFRLEYRCAAVFAVSHPDSGTARQLAAVFPPLAQTDYMGDLIARRLAGGELGGQIAAGTIEGTDMVELSVTGSEPRAVYDLLLAVLDAFPEAAEPMAEGVSITIRQAPVLPTAPVRPFSPIAAAAKGGAAGILLGLAVTALFALLTMSVDSAEALGRLSGLPVLAELPTVRRGGRGDHLLRASDDPAMAEALRSLRLRVRRELEERNGKVLLLTGTVPGEGTTTVAANLCLSLAEEGFRVLLVDADLRRQRAAGLLRLPQTGPGLWELLQDPEQPLENFCRATFSPNLHCLSGTGTRKRHYSLDPGALRRLWERLGGEYDYIIVDAPACTAVSDTTVLCRAADAVLYTVKAHGASRLRIMEGIENLRQDGVPLIGCVLSGGPARRSRPSGPDREGLRGRQRLYLWVKAGADFLFALLAVLILLIPMVLLAAAIKLDDNGPIFFAQKRVGRNRQCFQMLKFRTMRADSPHHTPTHLLTDPRQHITRVGSFLRRTSLDELPQLLNILRGEMSIIGPRPALWSQFDLIEEREKQGVHQVRPGITGWAQINGRDELDIREKAALDGEYVRQFGPVMDLRCFFGTFRAVITGRGIAEGRREPMKDGKP